MLTKDLIKHQSGEYDLEVVQYLKLPGIALPSITTIMLSMSNLLELDLSHNEIKVAEYLNLPKLRRLDLSSNRISSLNEGWCNNLPSLTFLSLHGNQISDVDDVYTLTPLSPTLRTLYLRLNDDSGDSKNPCCTHAAYHNKVITGEGGGREMGESGRSDNPPCTPQTPLISTKLTTLLLLLLIISLNRRSRSRSPRRRDRRVA